MTKEQGLEMRCGSFNGVLIKVNILKQQISLIFNNVKRETGWSEMTQNVSIHVMLLSWKCYQNKLSINPLMRVFTELYKCVL